MLATISLYLDLVNLFISIVRRTSLLRPEGGVLNQLTRLRSPLQSSATPRTAELGVVAPPRCLPLVGCSFGRPVPPVIFLHLCTWHRLLHVFRYDHIHIHIHSSGSPGRKESIDASDLDFFDLRVLSPFRFPHPSSGRALRPPPSRCLSCSKHQPHRPPSCSVSKRRCAAVAEAVRCVVDRPTSPTRRLDALRCAKPPATSCRPGKLPCDVKGTDSFVSPQNCQRLDDSRHCLQKRVHRSPASSRFHLSVPTCKHLSSGLFSAWALLPLSSGPTALRTGTTTVAGPSPTARTRP